MAESLFDRVGGAEVISAAVEAHYNKVSADERIKDFFTDTDMSQLGAHQREFLTKEFGGPDNYTGKDMKAAHEDSLAKGLNDSHVDAFEEDMLAAFRDQGVAAAVIDEIKGVLESHRQAVLKG